MDNIKEIISVFVKLNKEEIKTETIIDKSVVQGSILIHRMYAELENIGYKIENYTQIKTFADLLKKINKTEPENVVSSMKPLQKTQLNETTNFSIGIDIEELTHFKFVDDFREDAFYTQNFSPSEIAYCNLQINPMASFAGKFSAKEAIVKADNSYQGKPFNTIEIHNNKSGKPYFKDFEISISHSESFAIAVATKYHHNLNTQIPEIQKEVHIETTIKSPKIYLYILTLLSISALLLSVVTLYLFSTK